MILFLFCKKNFNNTLKIKFEKLKRACALEVSYRDNQLPSLACGRYLLPTLMITGVTSYPHGLTVLPTNASYIFIPNFKRLIRSTANYKIIITKLDYRERERKREREGGSESEAHTLTLTCRWRNVWWCWYVYVSIDEYIYDFSTLIVYVYCSISQVSFWLIPILGRLTKVEGFIYRMHYHNYIYMLCKSCCWEWRLSNYTCHTHIRVSRMYSQAYSKFCLFWSMQ